MGTDLIQTGDVIELDVKDDGVTALVLLAADDALILDACDGTMPFVLRRSELGSFRKFEPAA
jgi:hypothetical protein